MHEISWTFQPHARTSLALFYFFFFSVRSIVIRAKPCFPLLSPHNVKGKRDLAAAYSLTAIGDWMKYLAEIHVTAEMLSSWLVQE